MANKAELLEQANKLGLKLTSKSTIKDIEIAIKESGSITINKDIEKTTEKEIKLAKAGKRSGKSIKEVEAKIEKEERKEKGDTTPQSDEAEAKVKKGAKPIVRSLLERRGKNYRNVAKLVDKNTVYSLTDALEIAVKTNPSKFDASVEIHVKLGVDPRQANQNIRAIVNLPNGTGKIIRIAVFAPESDHAAAKKAGADIIGDENLLKQLDREELNFDILITTPQYMPKLGKYARLLGPRGLMPNPKSGSVATNIPKAISEAKTGKVEYRVDKQAIIHLSIGKVSFGAKKLEENTRTFFDSLKSQKPTGIKGVFVKTTSISTTQGPGIKVENVIN